MALQFDEKPSGTTSPMTRSYVRLEDDRDLNPKIDGIKVSSREISEGTAVSRYDVKRLDPVTDLKQRLSLWGKFDGPQRII
jgi:hypothetical protein